MSYSWHYAGVVWTSTSSFDINDNGSTMVPDMFSVVTSSQTVFLSLSMYLSSDIVAKVYYIGAIYETDRKIEINQF